jgi:hypothetical protein
MAVTVTVLNQKHVPGVGLMTAGLVNFSGSYPAGGEASAGLTAVLSGRTTVDSMQFGLQSELTGAYDSTNKKLRIFKLTAGVPTEVTAGAYTPATGSIPFTVISR